MQARIKFLIELSRQKAFSKWFAVISFTYSAFALWRDELATDRQEQALRGLDFLPAWPLSYWIAMSFGLLAIWVFEASFLRQRPGMELLFEEAPRTIYAGPGPMRYGVSVGLRNGSSRRLSNCRLQLQVISHDGISRPAWVRHAICAPFSLSPDEIHYITVFKFEFDVLDAPLEIEQFFRKDNEWVAQDGAMILLPGKHEIVVEALSDDSRIGRIKLSVEHRNHRWWVNGTSTGEM